MTVRRIFGGKGVYHQALIIAVEVGGELRLKADAVTAPVFNAAGAVQWAYEGKRGEAVRMPYWSVPDTAWDDSDLMAGWVRLAFGAALRPRKEKG